MIAAYQDILTRKCDICGNLLGKRPQLPTIRRKIAANENQETKWEAHHADCL